MHLSVGDLPFANACQLLDLRHDLGYFELQPLREKSETRHSYFPSLGQSRTKPSVAWRGPRMLNERWEVQRVPIQFSWKWAPADHIMLIHQAHLDIVEQLSLPASDVRELIPLLQGQILRHCNTWQREPLTSRRCTHRSEPRVQPSGRSQPQMKNQKRDATGLLHRLFRLLELEQHISRACTFILINQRKGEGEGS